MKTIFVLLVPVVIFSGYFMSFGTEYGVSVGYSEDWISAWVGYPYSGFEMRQSWERFSFSEQLSSRIFESNLPGFGKIETRTDISGVIGGIYLGFSTEDATTVGDSEMVGGLFFGADLRFGDDIYAFLDVSSTFFGLYRKSERFYFGFAPVNELSLFPYSIAVGIGKVMDNLTLVVGYRFRSGFVAGVPTPVIDVGGLFFNFRVEK